MAHKNKPAYHRHCKVAEATPSFEFGKFLNQLERKRTLSDMNLLLNANLKNLTEVGDIKKTIKLFNPDTWGHKALTAKLNKM